MAAISTLDQMHLKSFEYTNWTRGVVDVIMMPAHACDNRHWALKFPMHALARIVSLIAIPVFLLEVATKCALNVGVWVCNRMFVRLYGANVERMLTQEVTEVRRQTFANAVQVGQEQGYLHGYRQGVLEGDVRAERALTDGRVAGREERNVELAQAREQARAARAAREAAQQKQIEKNYLQSSVFGRTMFGNRGALA